MVKHLRIKHIKNTQRFDTVMVSLSKITNYLDSVILIPSLDNETMTVSKRCAFLKGQNHAIFSNTLKIEKTLFGISSQDIMTKIPLKDYRNAKKLSTDVFAGR